MKFQRRKKEKIDISMTSMIDVVFLLLIFFMVTTSFTRQTEVKIKLPEANGAEAEDYPKSVTVTIDDKGDYYLTGSDGENRKLPDQGRETLMRELPRLAGQSKDIPFIINADGKTPHQAVMTVLDVAGQVGFSHITFATQEPKTEE
jgi:biopolymer transport protein ExbD